MRKISYDEPYRVRVSSVNTWRKCEFCGFCHSDDMSCCPRIKSLDKNFPAQKLEMKQ